MEISEEQIDAIKELFNLGVGQSANLLNEMLDTKISLEIPDVEIISAKNYLEKTSSISTNSFCVVEQSFDGFLTGKASLAFPPDSAYRLVSLLTGEKIGSHELGSVIDGTLVEVGNIVINGLLGSVSNTFNSGFNISLPVFYESQGERLLCSKGSLDDQCIIVCKTGIRIESLEVIGHIFLVIGILSMKKFIDEINQKIGE